MIMRQVSWNSVNICLEGRVRKNSKRKRRDRCPAVTQNQKKHLSQYQRPHQDQLQGQLQYCPPILTQAQTLKQIRPE